jgi:hypothetical protein
MKFWVAKGSHMGERRHTEGEWRPAIERPTRHYGRGEILFHMLLPVAALLVGVPLLLGWIFYFNQSTGDREPQLSLWVGLALSVFGGLELLVWRRRLRKLRAPAAVDAE